MCGGRTFRLAIGASVVLIGCAALEDLDRATPAAAPVERHDPPAPGARERVDVDDAAERIAEAACDRDEQCGDATPDSSSDCRSRVKTGLDPRLVGEGQCEQGVAKLELEDCLADLRSLDCSAELSTDLLARRQRCEAAALCGR